MFKFLTIMLIFLNVNIINSSATSTVTNKVDQYLQKNLSISSFNKVKKIIKNNNAADIKKFLTKLGLKGYDSKTVLADIRAAYNDTVEAIFKKAGIKQDRSWGQLFRSLITERKLFDEKALEAAILEVKPRLIIEQQEAALKTVDIQSTKNLIDFIFGFHDRLVEFKESNPDFFDKNSFESFFTEQPTLFTGIKLGKDDEFNFIDQYQEILRITNQKQKTAALAEFRENIQAYSAIVEFFLKNSNDQGIYTITSNGKTKKISLSEFFASVQDQEVFSKKFKQMKDDYTAFVKNNDSLKKTALLKAKVAKKEANQKIYEEQASETAKKEELAKSEGLLKKSLSDLQNLVTESQAKFTAAQEAERKGKTGAFSKDVLDNDNQLLAVSTKAKTIIDRLFEIYPNLLMSKDERDVKLSKLQEYKDKFKNLLLAEFNYEIAKEVSKGITLEGFTVAAQRIKEEILGVYKNTATLNLKVGPKQEDLIQQMDLQIAKATQNLTQLIQQKSSIKAAQEELLNKQTARKAAEREAAAKEDEHKKIAADIAAAKEIAAAKQKAAEERFRTIILNEQNKQDEHE